MGFGPERQPHQMRTPDATAVKCVLNEEEFELWYLISSGVGSAEVEFLIFSKAKPEPTK